MGRFLRLTAMLAAASVALFAAGTASGSDGANAYGVGGGWTGFAPGEHVAHFSFSAHEGGSKGDYGQVHWNLQDPDLPLDVTVDVDCVNVFPTLGGSAAWIDGTVTKVSPQPNWAFVTVGSRLQFEAFDGGQPSGTIPVDEFDAFNDQPGTCKTRPEVVVFPPNVTQGNVVISSG
jgi:hypothetical protein